jgi:hypothetical protein
LAALEEGGGGEERGALSMLAAARVEEEGAEELVDPTEVWLRDELVKGPRTAEGEVKGGGTA